ncbi:LLM class flavin-dependent oxidoreductase [Nonomuraea sp. NPDC050536]|uniref:LLM class flavin-dependent oxidoreductase n=1 Tax=Nonomuraea sp. NPDC050536 TaxID=3364366 RepID=UPI0037C95EE4
MKRTATVRLDRPITAAATLAKTAEDLGFDGVWVADHYFHRDATPALALMAAATERVTLGTAVVSPLLRHPALLASSTATLNEVSGGRFVLGLGAGGYEFASELAIRPRSPLGLTREAVEIVRGLQDGRAEVEGETFTTRGALRFAAGRSPIYLAGRGPKMLALAGEIADGVITHGLSRDHIRYVKDHVRSHPEGQASGPAQERVEGPAVVLMLDVQIDTNPEKARDALRPRCMAMAGGAYADELIEVYGLDPDDVGLLRQALRQQDRRPELVTDQMVDAFCLAGPPEHVAERLEEFAEAGVDEVILSVAGGEEDLIDLAKAVIR